MRNRRLVLGIGIVGLVSLLVVGLVVVSLSWMAPGTEAQTATPVPPPAGGGGMPRSITVVGEGKVSVTPEIAQASIGVETVAETVREATDEATETMTAVLEALIEAGVAERDIQTSGYSIWSDRGPMYEGITDGGGVIYRVNNHVTVTIRDLDTIGEVLDAAIEAGANSMYGVSFMVEDRDEYTAEAREAAVENALAKANELAELNGVEVGQVVSVSEVVGAGGYYPQAVRDMGLGGGAGPFQPGEMEIGVQLQIVYAIQ